MPLAVPITAAAKTVPAVASRTCTRLKRGVGLLGATPYQLTYTLSLRITLL